MSIIYLLEHDQSTDQWYVVGRNEHGRDFRLSLHPTHNEAKRALLTYKRADRRRQRQLPPETD